MRASASTCEGSIGHKIHRDPRPNSDKWELSEDACAEELGGGIGPQGRGGPCRGGEWCGMTRGDYADLRSDKFVELHLTDALQESKRGRKTQQRLHRNEGGLK